MYGMIIKKLINHTKYVVKILGSWDSYYFYVIDKIKFVVNIFSWVLD